MIIDIKPIKDIYDVLELDIILPRITGGYLREYRLLEAISSWFNSENHGVSVVATATTVILDDYSEAPVRNDFPDWEHPAGHVPVARKYWDWFKWKQPNSKLMFSDCPDFSGELDDGHYFWGDIGQTSALAIAQTQKQMGMNDLWISVLDEEGLQVIIQSHVDLRKAWNDQLDTQMGLL